MKILITGATGLVGRRLVEELIESGIDDIRVLTRNKNKVNFPIPVEAYEWDYTKNYIESGAFEGVDCVFHLAGEGVADGRWNKARKKRILESRVLGTRLIMEAIKASSTTPKKFISSSAIGIYGNRGDEKLDTRSEYGEGYLADVCKQWENEVFRYDLGMKVHAIRTGIVLSNDGGALKKMLPPFKMGIGGILGSGDQYMSWIHIDDLVRQFLFLLEYQGDRKVYNGTAPHPVSNYEFTKILGKVLKRPTIFPVPGFVVKTLFGEMSDILLNSQRVFPNDFIEEGFNFKYRSLEKALGDILKHSNNSERVLKVYQYIEKPVDKVFPFFSDESNLEKITPDHLNFKVLNKTTDKIEKGTIINYKLKVRGVPMNWKSKISLFEDQKVFVDEQLEGPYNKWVHTHGFIPTKKGTIIKDHIVYKVPLGAFGDLFVGPLVKRDVGAIFNYRKKVLGEIFK